jgi:nitrite reductase/ring-hydroxylating ferredoxin subunit
MDRCRPAVPLPGAFLCHLDSIDEGDCREVSLGEGENSLSVLLHRQGNSVRAYLNICPHFSLPLNGKQGRFLLVGSAHIMCAWHCAVFKLEDGRCTSGPAWGMSLERIPVRVQRERVYIGEE